MTRQVSRSIHVTSGVAASIAAVLSPIPMADEIVFVPLFGWLARRIAREHGLGWTKMPWRAISKTTLNGLVARATINLAVSFVPGVAAVANAVSAVLLTQFLGRYIDGACADPERAEALGVSTIVAGLRRRTADAQAAPAAST